MLHILRHASEHTVFSSADSELGASLLTENTTEHNRTLPDPGLRVLDLLKAHWFTGLMIQPVQKHSLLQCESCLLRVFAVLLR